MYSFEYILYTLESGHTFRSLVSSRRKYLSGLRYTISTMPVI